MSLATEPPTVTNRGPGCHRYEPTLWNDFSKQYIQTYAAIDMGEAGVVIQADRVCSRNKLDDHSAAVLSRITVGPAESTGDCSPGANGGRESSVGAQFVGSSAHKGPNGRSGPAPAGQCALFGLHEMTRLLLQSAVSRAIRQSTSLSEISTFSATFLTNQGS